MEQFQFEFSATDVEDGANLQTEVLVTMPNGAQVPASASCTDGTCTGVTSTIPEAGTVTVFVTATDSRGESASNQGAIQAIPKADSSGISGDFSASPANWDRQIATILNQKSFVEITFNTAGMTIHDARFQECISTNGTGTGPIRGAEYLSNIDFISSSEDNV